MDNLDRLFNSAIAFAEANDLQNAISTFNEMLVETKNNPTIFFNLGLLHFLRQEFKEALNFYNLALNIDPNDPSTLTNKGAVLNELQLYDEALKTLDLALKHDQNLPEAWCNKGVTLNELHFDVEAIAHYDKAISINPNYAEAWQNKGVAYSDLKLYKEALEHFDKAISINPNYAEAWYNKGVAYSDLKLYKEALNHYDRAISLNENISWIHGNLLHTKMLICDWQGIHEILLKISHDIKSGRKVSAPFSILSITDSPSIQKKCSEIYNTAKFPTNHSLKAGDKNSGHKRIKVGYFSADFREHALTYLTAELFELHDKDKFELFAFAYGPSDESLMRKRLVSAFDYFLDVNQKTDRQIAELSRDQEIDIAIDLDGYTADSRMGIFSYQAAPIQVSYLGYLGTTGSEYIDYLISDSEIIPKERQKNYSEKIIYVPNYQVNDSKRQVINKSPSREELGLPEGKFVFCCFNNNYKITPEIFKSWMSILKNVEDSVLYLYGDNDLSIANLRREAITLGVNSDRLFFTGRVPRHEYLLRLKAADLFLDTSPYNAGASASDALWVGLPLITLRGKSFSSRVASSTLKSICLPELITASLKEYELLAIKLAKNPDILIGLKEKLARNQLTTPLFNPAEFINHIEAAYREIHDRHQKNLAPAHIYI